MGPPPQSGGIGVPPISQMGYPTPVEVCTDKQTENSTYPHPSDEGGNKMVHLSVLGGFVSEELCNSFNRTR